MNLIQFIDNRYQEVVVSQQEGPFSIYKDSEANSLKTILWGVRIFMCILFLPKVLLDYILVLIGLRPVPAPALELLKAQAEAAQRASGQAEEDKRLAKLGKKVGINTLKEIK